MEFLDFERNLVWEQIRRIEAKQSTNREALARCEILALRNRSLASS